MAKYILLIFIGWSLPQVVLADGFLAGNEFKTLSVEGWVQIRCQEGRRYYRKQVHCSGHYLDPAEFSSFVTDDAVDADKVELTAHYENGKSRTKKRKFSSAEQKSTKPFNLWIRTLFQRPLLDYGTNVIDYELSKKGDTVKTGQFEVFVKRGEHRICRSRTVYNPRPRQCTDTRGFLCEDYFHHENYCDYSN